MDTRERHAIYRAWAPDESPWSAWVKPVPFATLGWLIPHDGSTSPVGPVRTVQVPLQPGQAALIDLPGAESVEVGLRLAQLAGVRPVPIFASCTPEPPWHLQMVDTMAIQRALVRGAAALDSLSAPHLAPPVFLVDCARSGEGRFIDGLRYFDNRSALFPSDFPSGEKLLELGVKSCVVVRDTENPIGDDLRYALLPWRKAGIAVTVSSLSGECTDFPWPPSGMLARLWNRLLIAVAFRRNSNDGYGRFVPESSGG